MAFKNPVQQKAYAKRYYRENRQASIDRANVRRDEIKKRINEYKSQHPCTCGEGCPAALDFHHVGGKLFWISSAISNGLAWDKIEVELAKCRVICRNCHAKLHWVDDEVKSANRVARQSGAKARLEARKEALRLKVRVGHASCWKGKSIPEDVKRKMSAAHKGKVFSTEHKKALSDAHKGMVFSESHRKNLAEAQRKRFSSAL